MGEANGNGSRKLFGFGREALLAIAVQAIGCAVMGGMYWKSVSAAPDQISELKVVMDKRFEKIADKLDAVGLQSAAIADLNTRQHELAVHLNDTDGKVVQLQLDMRGATADINNIKA